MASEALRGGASLANRAKRRFASRPVGKPFLEYHSVCDPLEKPLRTAPSRGSEVVRKWARRVISHLPALLGQLSAGHLFGIQGVLWLGLSDAVDLEANPAHGFDVHYSATIEHKGRLGHVVVDALVVKGLELVPVKHADEVKRVTTLYSCVVTTVYDNGYHPKRRVSHP